MYIEKNTEKWLKQIKKKKNMNEHSSQIQGGLLSYMNRKN